MDRKDQKDRLDLPDLQDSADDLDHPESQLGVDFLVAEDSLE
jgi:hypothetical protein